MTPGMLLANQLEDLGYTVFALMDDASELLLKRGNEAFVITVHQTVPYETLRRITQASANKKAE